MSARSDCLCGVTFRRGQRTSFPCDNTTSNAWDGSGSVSNVLSNIMRNLSGTTLPTTSNAWDGSGSVSKEKLVWNNTSAQQTTIAGLCRDPDEVCVGRER